MTRIKLSPGLVVITIAVAANGWMAALQFQSDDYSGIPDAGWMAGLEPRPPDAPPLAERVYSYRPALWALLYGLLEASGGRAAAWVFHLFFLCSHAAASWLLYRLIAARTGPFAGVVGGSLFAILPGGNEAVRWISAGGDQLAVLFMLLAGLASDRALRAGSAVAVIGCGVAAFCAECSKETAAVLLPALAILWAIPPVHVEAARRRTIVVAFAAVAGMTGAWALRAHALGTWLPEYWTGAHAGPSQMAALPTALRGFLIPWNEDAGLEGITPLSVKWLREAGIESHAALTWLSVATAIAVLVPLAAGFALASWRRRIAMIAIAASLLAAVLPVVPLIPPSGLGLSRAFYPASALLAALMAASIDTSTTSRARWSFAALVPLVLISADLLAFIARSELRVAATIRAATDDLERLVEEDGEIRSVLIDPPAYIGNVPFAGAGLANAIVPPFGDSSRRPVVWPSSATLHRAPALVSDPSSVQVLEWDGRHVVRRGPIVPPIPGAMPLLEQDRTDPGLFRPRAPVPPRAAPAIRIEPSGSSPVPAGVVTWIAGSRSRVTRFGAIRAGACVVSLSDEDLDEPWLSAPSLDAIRVEGVALDRAPVLLRALPAITIERPLRGEHLDLMAAPRVAFRSDAPVAHYRVTFELILSPGGGRIPVAWPTTASEICREPGGDCVFVAERPAAVAIEGRTEEMSWNEIAARILPYAHGRHWVLQAELLVEGLDAAGSNAVARSARLPLGFVRRK